MTKIGVKKSIKVITITFFIAIGFFAFAEDSQAATYYITQSGTGDGSDISTPDSVADFNAGALSETDGDIVYFLDSFTTGIIPSRSGTSSAIILRGDYVGRDASVVVSTGSAIDIQSKNYISIINIDGESNDTASNTAGIETGGSSSNTTIDGGTYKGAWRVAHIYNTSAITINNSTFWMEEAHYATYTGFVAWFGHSSSSGSTFTNLAFDSDYDGDSDRPTNSNRGPMFDGTSHTISDITMKKWRMNSDTNAWNFYISAPNSTVTNVTMGDPNDSSQGNDGNNFYVDVDGVTLDNVNVYNAKYNGIYINGASSDKSVIIRNSHVEDNVNGASYNILANSGFTLTVDLDNNSAVNSGGSTGFYFSRVLGTIDDCTYENTTENAGGFSFNYGSVVTVNNSTVTGNRSDTVGHSGFGSGSSSNITYNNCTAQELSTDGFGAVSGSYTCNRCLAINNGNDTVSHWGDGFTAHEVGDITIRNSVAYGNTKSGSDIQDSGADDASIYIFQNNTFYNNGDGLNEDMGIGFIGDGMSSNDTFIIENNILVNNGGYPIKTRGSTIDTIDWTAGNNIFYESSSYVYEWNDIEDDFATWKTNSGGDANSSEADPLFTTTGATPNLTLQSASPAIDAGIDLNLAADYAGNSRYDMPSIANTGSAGSYSIDYTDIGAYEYITPPDPTLSSSTHASETTWYNSISPVTVAFSSPYDTTGKAATTDFKYLINQTLAPSAAAVQAGSSLDDLITFNAGGSITSDGTWYVHAMAQNENDTSNYSSNYDTHVVKYDSTGPTVSNSAPASSSSTESTSPTFTWTGLDASSGINYYQLYIDNLLDTNNISTTSATSASALSCGDHTWYIKAIDNAGNSTSSSAFNLTVSCGENLEISNVDYESNENSITIEWETNNKADETIRYGETKEMKKEESDDDKEKDHKLTLKNLKSDTTYYFRIKSKDSNDSEDRSRIYEVKTKKEEKGKLVGALPNLFGSYNKEKEKDEPEKTIIEKVNEIPEKIKEIVEETKFFNTDVSEKNGKKYLEEVRFQIKNEEGNPIPNLPVTLYSDPKTTITDKDGYAIFNDVEIGRHNLVFNYNNKDRKYSININTPKTDQGEVQIEAIVVQVKNDQTNWMIIAILLIIVIVVLIVMFIRRKDKDIKLQKPQKK